MICFAGDRRSAEQPCRGGLQDVAACMWGRSKMSAWMWSKIIELMAEVEDETLFVLRSKFDADILAHRQLEGPSRAAAHHHHRPGWGPARPPLRSRPDRVAASSRSPEGPSALGRARSGARAALPAQVLVFTQDAHKRTITRASAVGSRDRPKVAHRGSGAVPGVSPVGLGVEK